MYLGDAPNENLTKATTTGVDHIGLANTTGWDDNSLSNVSSQEFVPKSVSPGPLITVIPSPIARPTKSTFNSSKANYDEHGNAYLYDIKSKPNEQQLNSFNSANVVYFNYSDKKANDDHVQMQQQKLQQNLDKVVCYSILVFRMGFR